MDAEVSTFTTMPPMILTIEADDPSSSLDIKEPTVNGLPHKQQLEEEQADSSTAKACDSSAENLEILTFKVDSVPSSNKMSEPGQEKIIFSDEESLIVVKKDAKNQVESSKEQDEINDKDLEKDDDEEEDDEEDMMEEDEEGDDDTDRRHSSTQQKRPKRDVQRRSVFEMLQSEIHDDDEEEEDERGDVEKGGSAKGRKKRKNSDEELDLGDVNDDDDDEDFTADGGQRKSPAKKKPALTKKEEKTLVLFDDDDLPLKGKRSGGRPKKKKPEDEDMQSEDDWQMAGRIKGKLFHDDDDDHENDIDDFSYRQQTPNEKKVLTSSNKRSFDGSSKKQTCSKKIKIDVQGWKFSKSRDGMESKSKSSSGPSAQHQTSGHHSSGANGNVSALRQSNEVTSRTSSLQEDELRRKNNIMTVWEQKLRHLDRELEERVAIIRRNEGKVLREERRLKEYEAFLCYREKLLNNCDEFVHGSGEDATEKLSVMKRDYEKYRRLAEDHKAWLEREHRKLEAHALGKPFDEEVDSESQDGKVATSDLPSLETANQVEAVQTLPTATEKDVEAAQELVKNDDRLKMED